jgi:integrase/recombinase XerC
MNKLATTPRPSLAVEQFIEELRVVRQLSPHTLKAYRQDLQILCSNLESHLIEFHEVKTLHTRSWVSKLHSEGLSPRSISRLLSAWRTFFDWLLINNSHFSEKNIKVNPVHDLRAPRKAKSLPKALSVEFAIALMEKAQEESKQHSDGDQFWVYQRDQALFELFYSSGLRLSEILSIDSSIQKGYANESVSWISWDTQEVHVLGKGGKRRIVPIGTAAFNALLKWFDTWSDMLCQKELVNAPLFINDKLKRLSPRTVQERIKNLAIRAGLPMHVHPHMLRHSFASHVLQSSHDLRAVQEMLGHASIGSTQIYTALDFQHLAQAYDLAHPRAKADK